MLSANICACGLGSRESGASLALQGMGDQKALTLLQFTTVQHSFRDGGGACSPVPGFLISQSWSKNQKFVPAHK